MHLFATPILYCLSLQGPHPGFSGNSCITVLKFKLYIVKQSLGMLNHMMLLQFKLKKGRGVMTSIDKNLNDLTNKPKYSYVAIFLGNGWEETPTF